MKNQDAFENYLVYGIHIPNRKIHFGYLNHSETEDEYGHDFHFTSVALAIRAIDLMVTMNSKPIEIHMTSWGGCPENMLALLDKIMESPCPIKFYGRGRISSAATWIMAVADERYLAENTTIMVHDGSAGYHGDTTNLDIYTKENNRLQEVLNEIYAKNSRMPKDFWDAIVRRDVFLTAEEAIILGLADAIIPYKGRSQFRKGIRAKNFENPPTPAKLKKLVNRIAEQTKMVQLKSIEIHTPHDKEEEIPEYDNTKAELKKLDIKDIDNSSESDKVE